MEGGHQTAMKDKTIKRNGDKAIEQNVNKSKANDASESKALEP